MTKTTTVRGTSGTTKQIAYYTGAEAGEESIAWSQEYNYSGSVKTLSVYTNDAGVLKNVAVYKDDAVKTGLPAQAVLDAMVKKSVTYYQGDVKGSEKSDYTYNFRNGSVDTTTTYRYFKDATHQYVSALEAPTDST